MKKIVTILIIIAVTCCALKGVAYAGSTGTDASCENEIVQSISEKIIRFHVIANSDNEKDQALKLKVKDNILSYMQPLLKNSKSIAESKKIIQQNDEKIKAIARKVIKDNGYSYSVTTTLGRENFPVKTYGDITLPQGNYEAYRVIIGSGQGRNWWCVMFPPLCFVDITKGEIANKQTEKEMKSVLNEKEYNLVNSNNSDKKQKNGKTTGKIIYKFKIVELFQELIKKL